MVSDFSPVAMFSGYNINVSSDYFATFLCTIRVDWRWHNTDRLEMTGFEVWRKLQQPPTMSHPRHHLRSEWHLWNPIWMWRKRAWWALQNFIFCIKVWQVQVIWIQVAHKDVMWPGLVPHLEGDDWLDDTGDDRGSKSAVCWLVRWQVMPLACRHPDWGCTWAALHLRTPDGATSHKISSSHWADGKRWVPTRRWSKAPDGPDLGPSGDRPGGRKLDGGEVCLPRLDLPVVPVRSHWRAGGRQEAVNRTWQGTWDKGAGLR